MMYNNYKYDSWVVYRISLALIYVFYPNYLHGLWNTEVQFHLHKESRIIPILSRINSIPRIDTYRQWQIIIKIVCMGGLIRKRDSEGNIWVQERCEWGVEKAPQ